jgi:hypothetical protein
MSLGADIMIFLGVMLKEFGRVILGRLAEIG